jgi:hypothetical protein
VRNRQSSTVATAPTTTVGLPSASERLDLQLLVKQLKLDLLSSRHRADGEAGVRRKQQM